MYDAIVLAGGTARRLGGAAKPQLSVAGVSLLDRAVAAVGPAGRIVVAGPRQPVAGAVLWCREEPPGGGPVAAVAAALPLTVAEIVLVLAADLPRVGPAVPRLLAAVPADGLAALADSGGRVNHLAAAWRRPVLAAALDQLGPAGGAAMHRLVAGRPVRLVPDLDDWGRDCDTWDDLARARARAAQEEG